MVLITGTLFFNFIGDIIGVPKEELDWSTHYLEKLYALICYICGGFYLYIIQKGSLNDKMLKEFS